MIKRVRSSTRQRFDVPILGDRRLCHERRRSVYQTSRSDCRKIVGQTLTNGQRLSGNARVGYLFVLASRLFFFFYRSCQNHRLILGRIELTSI